jgi:hypothetical protein
MNAYEDLIEGLMLKGLSRQEAIDWLAQDKNTSQQ